MQTRMGWKVKHLQYNPTDRKLFGSKWVFKKTMNSVKRGRLVALGYSQVPCVAFSENFAPVVDDTTFRIGEK
jgi:Reverse transcriptase (RNA-dependent DNA polymerase)